MHLTTVGGVSDAGSRNQHLERRLEAVFAADVAGYSRLMASNEAGTLATLKAHRKLIDAEIAARHGRIVGTAGDSVLAEFQSPVEAAECAVAIQRELGKRNAALPERRRMEFRIGINLGDIIVDGEQIYGDGVNVAARLEGLADAGGICLSQGIVDHVGGKVPYWFDDMGRQRVKNIPEPVRVYSVDYDEGSWNRKVAHRRRRRFAAVGSAALLLTGGGLVAWLAMHGSEAKLPTPPADLEVFRDCENCPELVVVPPGEFLMGSSPGEPKHQPSEGPRQQVTIDKPFAVGRYEVTFAQWDACVEAGACTHAPNDRGWGRGNRPIIYVNWRDANEYTAWLSDLTGQTYRLPSEAEWEYTARAGQTGEYWWGERPIEGLAVCGDCGGDGDVTAPVGSFPPNPFGVYDVHGNVWEWTGDCWNGTYAGAPRDGKTWLTGECSKRVVRGGAWGLPADELRLAHRRSDDIELRSGKRGFRVIRELE